MEWVARQQTHTSQIWSNIFCSCCKADENFVKISNMWVGFFIAGTRLQDFRQSSLEKKYFFFKYNPTVTNIKAACVGIDKSLLFKHLFRPFTICHNSRLQDFCIIAFSLFRLIMRGDADEHCHPIKCWSCKAQLCGGDLREIYFCQLLHINFPNMNLQRSKKDSPIRCVFRSLI